MPKKKNETRVVAWFIPKKSLIKFDGDEDSIQVSDHVMEVSNFEKYPIMKNDTVEVNVENDEVVFLRKVKDAKKSTKKETKSENNSEVDSVVEKEVFCVSKYGLKFKGDKDWTNFSDDLQKENVKSKGVVAKAVVKASLSNGKIVAIETVEDKKEEAKSTTKSETKRNNSYRDEDSTDKRTAVMCAKDIVNAYIASKAENVNTVSKAEQIFEQLTKTIYKTIQNLG